MGQILSEEDDQDEAINYLIDALRWDSKNDRALLMMGNIFAKHKNDIPTAMQYYDQALIANPDDYISINNIGANLMQQKKFEEAKEYFHKALQINDQFPNTHFALGLIAEAENQWTQAFNYSIQALKLCNKKDILYKNSLKLAFETAKKIIETDIGEKILNDYKTELEVSGPIEIIKDNDIPTAAKFELAENYDRDKHIVRHKPSYPAVEHLIMHELVHLDFIIQARNEGVNQLFISTQEQKTNFIRTLDATIQKFSKMGVSEEAIASYCSNLFDGLNRQVYNAPIDLFIEDFLYSKYPDLRPYQFISLFTIVQEGLRAVTDKDIVDLSPKDILSKSKIYNLVNALQVKDLYGINMINDYKAKPVELKQATRFYDEYLEYQKDREAGEEYELLLHWAEDLKLNQNFELVNETEYRKQETDIDSFLTSIEDDPYDLKSDDSEKERELKKFIEAHQDQDLNSSVVMYMVDALQHFKGMSKEEIKDTAFEIAMLGRQGFDPAKKGYQISSFPEKSFSGYHILAYYYVSWALAIPEMLEQLNMPFDKEYELAKSLNDL